MQREARGRITAPICALLLLVGTATAQGVVVREDFESGASGWTFQGVCHVESDATACGSATAPYPSPGHAVWFGSFQPQAPGFSCNYEGTWPAGARLELNAPVALPAGTGSISLRYRRFLASEGCTGGYDVAGVRVQDASGSSDLAFAFDCRHEPGWSTRRVDLTPFAGTSVRLTFSFQPNDGSFNHDLGWWIDDVEIAAEPGFVTCTADAVCPCSSQSLGPINPGLPANEDTGGCKHSSGKEARLFGDGVASVANDTVELVVHDLPQSTSLIYVQGLTPQSIPFGDGKRCFGGTAVRLAVRAITGGQDTYPHAGEPSVALKGAVPALGGSRTYQVVYRDAATYCTSSTFNTSNGYVIAWQP